MNNKKFENCIDKAIEENLMNCTISQERTIKMEGVVNEHIVFAISIIKNATSITIKEDEKIVLAEIDVKVESKERQSSTKVLFGVQIVDGGIYAYAKAPIGLFAIDKTVSVLRVIDSFEDNLKKIFIKPLDLWAHLKIVMKFNKIIKITSKI